MTTVADAMKHNEHKAFKFIAIGLSLIVYCAGLIYAGVRAYSLFAATIEAWLLPLALIGIVALELTAIGLPLAIHFWTQPGGQRIAAYVFYGLDLMFIAANAILDAANHKGANVSDLLINYGIYVVPALPLFCMAGWSIIWILDPSSRERDMRESVKAATQESLLAKIQEAAGSVDITKAVESAANEAARALVGETLGNAPKLQTVTMMPMMNYNAESEALPAMGGGGVPTPKAHRNGRKPQEVNSESPKD